VHALPDAGRSWPYFSAVPSLVFVTPAWRRFELTRICLEQRRHVCGELERRFGISASCVVVADDENLESARALGFETVERDNRYLGRRFNDGYAAAARLGADYGYAIGSDSFVDPDCFAELPPLDTVTMSRLVSVVRADGSERVDLDVVYPDAGYGAAAIVPTRLYAPSGFRPCKETAAKGCEASTWRRGFGRRAARVWREGRVGELVNFQTEIQVTPWPVLRRWTVSHERDDPFGLLREIYPPRLLQDVEELYRVALAPI